MCIRDSFTYGPGSEPAETKETEIGEIPAHWEVTELAALCAGDGGAIQTGPFGSQLHAADSVSYTHLDVYKRQL